MAEYVAGGLVTFMGTLTAVRPPGSCCLVQPQYSLYVDWVTRKRHWKQSHVMEARSTMRHLPCPSATSVTLTPLL